MKNNYFKRVSLLVLILVTGFSATAQRERVKGSRNVKEMSQSLLAFNAIKVIDGLEVTLIADSEPGFDLAMDDNLLELINFNIRDSMLVVSTSKDIRSAKKLEISVRYTQLHTVLVQAKSKVVAQSIIKAETFNANVTSGASFEGEIKATKANLMANESSKLDIGYIGDDLELIVSDNAFAKADINTERFTLTATARTDVELTGNAETATITLADTAECKAGAFKTDMTTIVARGSANARVSADKEITIDLSDKSELELYGDSKIIVERFAGSAKLLKKD